MIDWKKLKDKKFWAKVWEQLLSFWMFFGLILLSMTAKFFYILAKIPIVGKFLGGWWNKCKLKGFFNKLAVLLDRNLNGSTIKRSYLISLAFANMKLKKARSLMTIVGMAVGVGSIVFLVSIGFGLEKLVVSRVARLDELKMADISPGDSVNLKLNDEVRKKIEGIENVDKALPLVSTVGRIRYMTSVTDVMVYGIQADYFASIGAESIKGKLFEENEISFDLRGQGDVAGIMDELKEGVGGAKINESRVNFNLRPGEITEVYQDSDLTKLLGYTGRIEGGYWGEEYWGSFYKSAGSGGESGIDKEIGEILGRLIKAKVRLLRREGGEYVPILDSFGRQTWEVGFVKSDDVVIVDEYIVEGEILGDSDVASASALMFEEVVATDSATGVEWVQMKSGGEAKKAQETISFKGDVSGKAVVSKAMARLFGSEGTDIVGKEFIVSYILTNGLVPGLSEKAMTEEEKYTVVGMIDDDTSAYFYVPIADVLKAGVVNYSQIKLVGDENDVLGTIRKEVETMGYKTTSTADTVAEIEKLFGNARVMLGFLGLIALGVAVLGMFNTLTVSLLERTREIGGMKAMGMLSVEIRDLLLAEAMIMGLTGGIAGLVFGFAGGEAVSLALTLFSFTKGQGSINISYLPFYFVSFIILMSFVVGLLTGLYPAKRAKGISALNALRYE